MVTRINWYNSISNIEEAINNVKYFNYDKKVELPTGLYEISDSATYFKNDLKHENTNIIIKANNNTVKSEICFNVKIDFQKDDSLASY